jgi:hypothetical protein
MDFTQLALYVHPNAAHECGHMTVLFRASRLVALNFLPHETALDGVKGILESETKTAPVTEDCVGFAAGMIGELICLGYYDPKRSDDDRGHVQRLVGQPLENFGLEAYEVIKQNLLFFVLLNIDVRTKMIELLNGAYSRSAEDFANLPNKMAIFTLAEVEEVYNRAESILARFPRRPS